MDCMVALVAKAIHEKRRNPDFNKHWFHNDADKCELSMQLAKAAIKAMRDAQPTTPSGRETMTEIPDDVMKAAMKAVTNGFIGVEAVARAILAERERCAKVAISHAPATQDFADAPLQDMAKRIAAAIRK